MKDFMIVEGKLIRTEIFEHVWSDSHKSMLTEMNNKGGFEIRDKNVEAEKICNELVNMDLATLVHSTFFLCYRITTDGIAVLEAPTNGKNRIQHLR